MKFLVDMPLSHAMATWLAERGHDAAHALRLGLDRAPDEVILERARREGRVVVTADLDYPRLLAISRAEGPGLILFRGGDWGDREATDRLETVLERIPEEDLPHSIIVVERLRLRQRRLPIGGG